jgi:hypothetical protein
MSRGPGGFQVRVLDVLASYRRLGADLGWTWRTGSRYTLSRFVMSDWHVRAYEDGEIVPCWILRRDLDCDRATLARALAGLERQGLVYRRGGNLEPLSETTYGKAAKYASLTVEGAERCKRQHSHSAIVGAYRGAA